MNYSNIILLLLICQNLFSQDEVEKPCQTGQKIQYEEIIVRKLNLPDTLYNIIYIKNTEELGVKEKSPRFSIRYESIITYRIELEFWAGLSIRCR